MRNENVEALPGRTCPMHYRYAASVFNQVANPAISELDVLYVVGGLYGNVLALETIEAMFAAESGHKRMVFNGDFHWFDANNHEFAKIEKGVSKYLALRGNVETEIVSVDDDAGCGCAYPDWVENTVVERSNLIMQRLRNCATPAARSRLANLPMWEVASVGNRQIGIVHGDAESLAGWGFAQEHLQQAEQRETVATWFNAAQVDVFASTHTCLPVLQEIQGANKKHWVVNNGSAGMPNFEADAAGLVTRIAMTSYSGSQSRAHVQFDKLHIDLLAVEIDQALWQAMFMQMWPTGSHAHASYWNRIVNGPNYHPGKVVRYESVGLSF